MSSFHPHHAGIAERLGRWSARHRAKALLGWVALVLVAFVAAGTGERTLTSAGQATGESARAERMLAHGGFEQPATEEVLLQARGSGTIRDAAGERAARSIAAAVAATGRVVHVRQPFSPGHEGQISRDGRSAVVLFELKGERDTADERIGPVLAAVDRVAARSPQLRIAEIGTASANKQLKDTLGKDFKRAEGISIPLTLAILWLAFAALAAAVLPVALALSAIVIGTGLVTLASHAIPIDGNAHSLILLIGLAVGVDYSLFYFRRAREERAGGVSNVEAVATAAATSGKAVITSGLTVVVAMSAMFVTGLGTFMGMAEATALVVAVAMLGSLTALPALLAKLGDGVDRGRIPFLGRRLERRRGSGESRVWRAIVRPAVARPLPTLALAGGLLVLLAVPAFHLHTASPGVTDLPRSLAVVKAYDRIQHAFGANPEPAQVVVRAGNVDAPPVASAIGRLRTEALATGLMHEPITVDVNGRHTLARISVPLAGDGTNERSQRALKTLRSSVVPRTVGAVATTAVTGATARSVDFDRRLSSRAPYVFAFVLGLAFLLLLWNFRSLVIPTTAIVLNLLSVGAAYGVLVSVFQGGWGIVHVHGVQQGPIAAYLPLFLFVILFGLSMDYHVFILSRIREGRDRGLNTREAIRSGITHSAGVITGAAVVMVAVFATFATLSTTSMKQLGVGLAVAILLDATIVRGLLLPAAMTLLGERNWYLPRRLERLMSREPREPRLEGVPLPLAK